VCAGPGVECGALPIELTTCPCCGVGIKQSRGFTWVNLKSLRADKPCANSAQNCRACPMYSIERAGLLWVGEVFYKTAEKFDAEADAMGISRRIATVPNGFVIGETWIALAHRTAITNYCPDCHDGKLFTAQCRS